MRILLIGYGKMGRAIEKIATTRHHEIKAVIDAESQGSIDDFGKGEVDVAIEFTQPSSAFDNLSQCIENGIPVISGTTGWLDRYEELKTYCTQQNGTLLYASNFSLGVNLFFRINKYLAQLMSQYDNYSVDMEEVHHLQKLDKPSGTAITLAEGIVEHHDQYSQWVCDQTASNGEIAINSAREDKVPGTHMVSYRSAIDDIEIKHTAHSREGFALGAVMVAEWIHLRKGVFTMDDFLGFK